MRSPRRTLAAATVSLEAFVVFFAGLVAKDLSSLSTGAALARLRRPRRRLPAGRRHARPPVGLRVRLAACRPPSIATGFWVPVMFFLGALFAVLWFVALRQGARIERERAEYAARTGT